MSDLSTVGVEIVDQNLKNPWGLAASPTSPLWVADNNGNVATVYPGDVNGSPITGPVLTVPIPGGVPTGQVFNPTQGFKVDSPSGEQPAAFIFSSDPGRITAWSMGDGTGPAAPGLQSTAILYKGLAIWVGRHGALLYASNFHDGRVDVFNSRFHRVHLHDAFQDHRLPDVDALFGIEQIHGRIYVSYAKQDADKEDDAKGPGRGFIYVWHSPTGRLLHRLASCGRLDSPWGMTLARRDLDRSPVSSWSVTSATAASTSSPRSADLRARCGTSLASRSRSTGCGVSSSATAQPVAGTPCCSAPGSMTRRTGSSAPSARSRSSRSS